MNLSFHAPSAALAPFVRRIIVSDYEVGGELAFSPWSTGNIYVIWFFGDLANYDVEKDGEVHRFASPLWLAGQTEYHKVRIAIRRRTAAVVVELAPQGFWCLTGRPGRWLTGRTCEFGDISAELGALAASATERPVSDAEDCRRRMEAFLTVLAERAGPADPMLERAIADLAAYHGRVAIEDVAARAGVTQRHLTRRFGEIVGLCPKFYGRVLQLNQVIELLFMPGHGSIAGVACDAGYYDQAHLNRALKLFVAEGPSAFLKGDHDLFRTFLEQPDTKLVA